MAASRSLPNLLRWSVDADCPLPHVSELCAVVGAPTLAQAAKGSLSDEQMQRAQGGAIGSVREDGTFDASAIGTGAGDFGRAVIRQLVQRGQDPVAVLGDALRSSVASTLSAATSDTSGTDSEASESLSMSMGTKDGDSEDEDSSNGEEETSEEEEDDDDEGEDDDDDDDDDDEDDDDDDDDDEEESSSELELSLDATTIPVKWVFGDQVRKALLPDDMSFSKLRKRVRRDYKKRLQLAYLDQEGGMSCHHRCLMPRLAVAHSASPAHASLRGRPCDDQQPGRPETGVSQPPAKACPGRRND